MCVTVPLLHDGSCAATRLHVVVIKVCWSIHSKHGPGHPSVVLSVIPTVALVCALSYPRAYINNVRLCFIEALASNYHAARQNSSRRSQQLLQVLAMTAPWHENQQKVVVEFLKANQGAKTLQASYTSSSTKERSSALH
jgi:hypothetical protein